VSTTAALPVITEFRRQYRFLSSFYDQAPFTWTDWTGQLWQAPTREHAFQASKTVNEKAIHWVMTAPSAGEAKTRGRQVPLVAGWDTISRSVMLRLAVGQYQLYPELCALLAATAPAILIEGNSWGDYFWGAIPDSALGQMIPRWADGTLAGHNWLGRVLMMAREVLS
jgi:ribA/ribD-fused uncharacterized protein